MDPVLRIIHYLFKKHDIVNNDDTLDSFFSGGVAFPLFVELAFKTTIDGIDKNPTTQEQKKSNNRKTLQFLQGEENDFDSKILNISTDENKVNLLGLILTEKCYKYDLDEIFKKYNAIVQNIGIELKNNSDLIDPKCILVLFNVLTDGKVEIKNEIDDFKQEMINCFEKAKAPLVIDETSFEYRKQFTYFIQFEIIFEVFSDKIDQLIKNPSQNIEKPKIPNYIEEKQQRTIIRKNLCDYSNYHEIKFNMKMNIMKSNQIGLLNTINAIVSVENLHFDTLLEAIEKDNLNKFVKIFFNDYIEQSNDVIGFLCNKEPIFKTMIFDFKSKKKAESSAISFFTKFLNCFFLKQTKQDLLMRCISILLENVKNDDRFYYLSKKYKEKKNNFDFVKQILFEWDMYLALFYFCITNKTHFTKAKIKELNYDYIDKYIPQVIDENYLKINPKETDVLYYQLQFIFDVIDANNIEQKNGVTIDKGFLLRLHETILTKVTKLGKIKVPPFGKIATSLLPKKFAIIHQIKTASLLEKQSTLIFSSENDKDQPILAFNEDYISEDTFSNRQFINTLRGNRNNKRIKSSFQSEFQSYESFWNPDEEGYSTDDGVLFKTLNDAQTREVWNDETKRYKHFVEIKKNLGDKTVLFSSIPKQNDKSKLYKFFYYDEQNKQWKRNKDIVDQFINEKFFKHFKSITPLVMFLNSFEKDTKMVLSNLMNSSYPDLDDEQIYVYGICDKPLTYLKYELNLSEGSGISKPIFLILHVPESKKNLSNIRTIIYQIYYFLSFICDIAIVILNDMHSNEQIELMKKLRNIQREYTKGANYKMRLRSSYDNESNLLLNSVNQHSNDISSDGDEIVDCDDKFFEEISDDCDGDEFCSDIFNEINYDIFQNKAKLITLINGQNIHDDIFKEEEIMFFNDIKQKINDKSCLIHYINVNEPITYRMFLTSLYNLAKDIVTIYNKALNNFLWIGMSKITITYINMKSRSSYYTQLKEMIRKRFKQFMDKKQNESNYFKILSKLQKEIAETYPSIDVEYTNECNSIIDDLKNEGIKINKNFIELEMNKSSQIKLRYFKSLIDTQYFWSEEKKENGRKSHINFLKKEYFNIIQYLYPNKYEFSYGFQSNHSILDNKIEQDLAEIDNYYKEKFKIDDPVTIDADGQNKRGTNYTIREKENVREIKVIVEAGHLKDVIDQDF